MQRFFLFIFLSGIVCTSAQAQKAVRMHISFEYGVHFPGNDLSQRFGTFFSIATQYEVMTTEPLWHAGVKGMFLFGNRVNEDVISNLRTAEGDVIGNDRALADISLRKRGILGVVYIGKVFPLSKKQPHSGIKLSLGGGVMQHKIRIQDNNNSVSQLTGEYVKGYDRLTNGPALYGFLGYQHLALKKRLNFVAGLDYVLGFTTNKRAYNFNEKVHDGTSRTDSLFGFRIGLILPITYGVESSAIFY